jgi:hypothetical protein
MHRTPNSTSAVSKGWAKLSIMVIPYFSRGYVFVTSCSLYSVGHFFAHKRFLAPFLHQILLENILAAPSKSEKRKSAGRRRQTNALQSCQHTLEGSIAVYHPLPLKSTQKERQDTFLPTCLKFRSLFQKVILTRANSTPWRSTHCAIVRQVSFSKSKARIVLTMY